MVRKPFCYLIQFPKARMLFPGDVVLMVHEWINRLQSSHHSHIHRCRRWSAKDYVESTIKKIIQSEFSYMAKGFFDLRLAEALHRAKDQMIGYQALPAKITTTIGPQKAHSAANQESG